jgi:hypothetical protein
MILLLFYYRVSLGKGKFALCGKPVLSEMD